MSGTEFTGSELESLREAPVSAALKRHLAALVASGALAPIDARLAELVARMSAAVDETAAMTAALVSAERGRGNSCSLLDEWGGRALGADALADTWTFPDVERWRELLRASPAVGDGTRVTPLVLDGDSRCYLYRYWKAERRLASSILDRVDGHPRTADTAALTDLFGALFPEAGQTGGDRQALAAALALTGRFTVVSGGPGTGKTTTVVRMLALLTAERPELAVRLAAPTGKAAARLGDSIRQQSAALDVDEAIKARIPTEVATLHRLLGYRPFDDSFRYDRTRPLAADVVIVDEASMVDLLMMSSLMEAVRPSASIVLLGDRDQLASVETGFVFGDLCTAFATGAAVTSATAERYAALAATAASEIGLETTATTATTGTTEAESADVVVELTTSYRFRERPGIGSLARAVREGDGPGALAVLESAEFAEVRLHAHTDDPRDVARLLADRLDRLFAAAAPAEAPTRLAGMRIRTALKRGRYGAAGLNEAVERVLTEGGREMGDTFYRGRPVMVTANDYTTELFNGDTGVCWPEDGRAWVWFPTSEQGAPRRVAPAKLPAHTTAWATTVHKSQGSEHDHTVLVLPGEDSPLLSRELVYTAVTRARHEVDVVADHATLAEAIARSSRRASGLAAALIDR